MAEIDYTPNSHKFKEENQEKPQVKPPVAAKKPAVEKVTTGKVKTKKKNEAGKVLGMFIAEDMRNVGTYILNDVVVPSLKKLFADMFKDAIDMTFYGTTNRGRSSSGTNANYVSYRSYSDKRDDDRYTSSRTRSGYSYDELIFDTRKDAEEVLSKMDEIIDNYGMVSVADMYDLVGQSCNYTDNNYGWTNIRSAEVTRGRDGWMIRLPKVLSIK